MQKILRLILTSGLLAVALVGSGCGVVSEHPVALLNESDPVPDHMLGTWQTVEVAGLEVEPGSGTVVRFDQNPDGSVRITLIGEVGSQEINASLAILGGRHILSFAPAPDDAPDDPSWLIANLVHDELADTLTVELLGHDVLSQDIELGRVKGEVILFEGEVDSQLTASTAGLQSYFAQYGQAFTDPIFVLERVSEQ